MSVYHTRDPVMLCVSLLNRRDVARDAQPPPFSKEYQVGFDLFVCERWFS